MVEFSRCPKCATLYDLRTLDISKSNGMVECGQCHNKFKAISHEVKHGEISFHKPEANQPESKNSPQDLSTNSDEEISEQTITMEVVSTTSDEYNNFLDDLLEPEMVVNNVHSKKKTEIEPVDYDELNKQVSSDLFESYEAKRDPLFESRQDRQKKKFSTTPSEFSDEEIDIKSDVKRTEEVSILEEMYEDTKTIDKRSANGFSVFKFFSYLTILLIALALSALFALQLHNRGTYKWLTDSQYEKIIAVAPILSKLEKDQSDLSKLHLASVKMEPIENNPKAKRIVLQMENRSSVNQAFPSLQVEFTNSKGEIVARRSMTPSLYLGVESPTMLNANELRKINLDFAILPEFATGYEIEIVKQGE